MNIELTNAEAKLISEAYNSDRNDSSLRQEKIPSALQTQADNILASRGLRGCKATGVAIECYENGNQYRIEYAALINTVLNDERDKVLAAMLKDSLGEDGSAINGDVARRLYAAGWRK